MTRPLLAAALTASLLALPAAARADWSFSTQPLAKPAAAAQEGPGEDGQGLRLEVRVDGAPNATELSALSRAHEVVLTPGKPTTVTLAQEIHYLSANRPVRARERAAERAAMLAADPAYATDERKAQFAALDRTDEGGEGPERVIGSDVETGVASVGLELVLAWDGRGPVRYTVRQVEADHMIETTAPDGTKRAAPVYRHARAEGAFAPAQGAAIAAPGPAATPANSLVSRWDKVVVHVSRG